MFQRKKILPVGHPLYISRLILLPDQSTTIRIYLHVSINTVYCPKKKNMINCYMADCKIPNSVGKILKTFTPVENTRW